MSQTVAGAVPVSSWAALPKFVDELMRRPDEFCERVAEERSLAQVCSQLLIASMALFAVYGACMGGYGGPLQSTASLVKMPLLFLSTLVISGPSLYVFNLVLGSQLNLLPMLTLMLFSITMTAVLAASLAPIALFFMLSGSSYRFMLLLHIAILAVAGGAGLAGMHRGLRMLCAKAGSGATNQVFRAWVLVYAVVGTQMGWLLRPFVGAPSVQFAFLRSVEGNFYTALFQMLFGGLGFSY